MCDENVADVTLEPAALPLAQDVERATDARRSQRNDVPERLVRPTKYLWIEHAERNAICNAARAGTATEACTIFVEIMPCMDCARAIVQAGIIEVVVSAERMAQYSSAYYDEHFGMVEVLFGEARVRVRRV